MLLTLTRKEREQEHKIAIPKSDVVENKFTDYIRMRLSRNAQVQRDVKIKFERIRIRIMKDVELPL